MLRQSRILLFYAVFLFTIGWAAFAAAKFDSKAKTSIYIGCGSGVVMLFLSWFYSPNSTNSIVRSITHSIPIFIFVLGCLFAWRSHLLLAKGDKQWLMILLGISSIVSFFVFIAILVAVAKDADQTRTNTTTRNKTPITQEMTPKPTTISNKKD